MHFGILEPETTAHVPGTILLDQQAAHSEDSTGRLKHGTGKDANIVLAPQPSEDPNDPLNWSPFKKNFVLAVIFFGVIIHGAVPGPILNAGIVEVSGGLGRSFTDVAKLSGYSLLATGATGPFASAFGRKYGKRPLYVFSSVVGTLGVIVSEIANSYNTLLAGRILQGIAVAAYESLAIGSIGDIFFVHERGSRIALVVFLLAAISNGVSIIAGVITANLGWHYNFHISLPFAALQTIFMILFGEETCYRRNQVYDIDTAGSEENLQRLAEIEDRTSRHREKQMDEKSTEDIENVVTTQASIETVPPLKTFTQRLTLYNGSFVEDSVVKMSLASIAILLNVGALYQIISTGLIIAWYVGVAIVSGVIFASPPYFLSSASIGYLSAGPLIGGLVGTAIPFFVSEPMVKYLTRRNHGVYEPEFCLIPTGFGGVCAVAGLVGWGFAIQNHESVYIAAFLWGLMLFGMTFFATFSTQWALDAYRQNSTEIFIMNMVFKNFFYYGLTNYVIEWFLSYGPVQVAGTMAGITAIMSFLAIPMYVLGKRYRYFWHKHNALKWLHLETADHAATQ